MEVCCREENKQLVFIKEMLMIFQWLEDLTQEMDYLFRMIAVMIGKPGK
jgi:hypothetical protein